MTDSPRYLPTVHVATFADLQNMPGMVGQRAIAEDTSVEYVSDGTKWSDKPLRVLTTKSSAPIITPAGTAGTGATGSASGTNAAGTITFTTGLSVAANGDLFTIKLADNVTFPTRMIIQLQGLDADTLGVIANIFQSSSTSSSAVFKVKGLGLSASTTYTFSYQIIGY